MGLFVAHKCQIIVDKLLIKQSNFTVRTMTAEKNVFEPNRKSVFDVLQDNFKYANRQIYVHRLIYIGQHTFSDTVGDAISDYLFNVINDVNSKYCDEKLTGFLLYYPRYFCHVIEGSEDTLLKHVRRVLRDTRFGVCKVLCVYHNINQRFLPNWTHITAKPATLLENIDRNSNLENTSSKIIFCIQKLYKLGALLKRQEDARRRTLTDGDSAEGGSSGTFLLTSDALRASVGLSQPVSFLNERKSIVVSVDNSETVTTSCLPEFTLLEFLIETNYTQTLQTYGSTFGALIYVEDYEDMVWPIASDGIPMDVFDKEVDPVNNLPNFVKQSKINLAEISDQVQ